jgi:hypothetical protein
MLVRNRTHILHQYCLEMLQVASCLYILHVHFERTDDGSPHVVRDDMYGIRMRGRFLMLDCSLYDLGKNITCQNNLSNVVWHP